MKNSLEIIGQPIISIYEGNQIGRVKSLVINPEKGSVDFLTIEHEDWQVSVKAIPFKKVIGIGEYAVTVENDSAVIDLNEIPIANTLVNKKIKITNTKVMTRKGQLLGEVLEYYIDDENGQIIAMKLVVSNKEVILAAEAVLTYGKDILIVKENASDHFVENISQIESDSSEEQAAPMSQNSPARDLKQKQIELLTGKTVSKNIYDQQGNTMFSKGTILSPKDIEAAQNEGPSVVVELSMNVNG